MFLCQTVLVQDNALATCVYLLTVSKILLASLQMPPPIALSSDGQDCWYVEACEQRAARVQMSFALCG